MKRIRFMSYLILVVVLSNLLIAGENAEQVQVPATIINDGIPPVPVEIQQKRNAYSEMKSAGFVSWNAQGNGMIIVTRLGNTAQLYWVDSALAKPKQLTDYEEPVFDASFCPDPGKNYFIFSKDMGGRENYQYFLYDVANNKTELITDGKSRNTGLLFNHKGNKIAFTNNSRTDMYFDIYIMDPEKPAEKKLVFKALAGAIYAPSSWFYDDRHLLIEEYISVNDVNNYVLDTETGEYRKIDPGTTEKCRFEIRWISPDGKTAYGISDRLNEMARLIKINLETGAIETITKDIPWDINPGAVSEDFKTAAFTANEGGIDRLYLMDIQSGAYKAAESVPVGSIGGIQFNRCGKKLALTLSSPKMNGDVFVLNLETKQLERWTESDTAGLDPSGFTEPVIIEYPTFDKLDDKPRMVPAFYYKPVKKSDKPFPVVIDIHGGPEGQFTSRFYASISYYVEELGIAVIAPNVRGSSGYGKTYLTLDNAEKREDSVKDIGALLDWIASQPELDKNRVAVLGGSYGGYMVLASMVHFSNRLACGVDIVGISNFVTFLKNTSPYRQDLRRSEYGDERIIGEFLAKISPLTNAAKIKKPLFVIQGKNDPRVPWTEAEQIVKIVRANGIPVWYQMATNEGHGFAKKDNRDYMEYSIINFYREFLLKEK
jgi:dipeptidyl aminopeptidase/acylaminoacyl peptidase